MFHRLLLIAVLFLAFGQILLGDEPLTEAQLNNLVKKSPKLYLPKLIEFTESQLNKVFQAALKNRDSTYQTALRKSQEAWKSFADADSQFGAIDSSGGSGSTVFAMERRLYQIRLRIYQLQTPFEQGWISIPNRPKAQQDAAANP